MPGRSRHLERSAPAGFAAGALALLVPPAAAVVAGVAGRVWRRRVPRGWAAVWSALAVPLVAGRVAAGDAGGAAWWLALCVVAFVVSVALRPASRGVFAGLAAALAVIAVAGAADAWLGARTWRSTTGPTALRAGVTVAVNAAGPVERLSAGAGEAHAWRFFSMPPGTRALEVSVESRLVAGVAGGGWWRSDPGIQARDLVEGGESFTRFTVPRSRDPYVARDAFVSGPVAGRRFRFSVQLRSPRAIPAQGARGLWLREEGGTYATVNEAVAVGTAWRDDSLEWVMPSTATANRVTGYLNDFDGLTVDARRFRLEEFTGGAWRALEPLNPTGAGLWVPDAAGGRAFLPVVPRATWSRSAFTVRFDSPPPPGEFIVEAYVGPGLTVETRNLRVATLEPSRRAVPPVADAYRARLWFAHPNLLGAAVVAAAVAALALAPSGAAALFIVIVAACGVALTGSRAALLGLAVGGAWLAWLACRPRERAWVTAALAVGAAALAVVARAAGWRVLTTGAGVDGTLGLRWDLWVPAWHAFLEHPLAGLGAGNFRAYYLAHGGVDPWAAVTHAHNLWLVLASEFGAAGLVGAAAFTAALAIAAWRWGAWRGVAVVTAVLVMNVFDYSLFTTAVLYPVVLSLNVLRARQLEARLAPGGRERAGERAAVARGSGGAA